MSQNGSSFLRKEAEYCREAATTTLGATGTVRPKTLRPVGPVNLKNFFPLNPLNPLNLARRRRAFLLSIFHMVSMQKICYNYRKFNAEICSFRLFEG